MQQRLCNFLYVKEHEIVRTNLNLTCFSCCCLKRFGTDVLHPIRHPFPAPNGVKSLWHISYKRPKTWLNKVYGKTCKIYVFYDFPRVIKHINLHSVIAHAQNKRDPSTRNEIWTREFEKKAHKQQLPQPATKSFDGEIERFLCFNQQIIIIILPTMSNTISVPLICSIF